jgi:hypothetical protein
MTAAAGRASVGPFLSAGRQLVHLLPYSHTSKPPICAGAVRIHKAAAMTGLDSTPSLSIDPTARPPDPADHLLLHTRARNSSLESSRESSGGLRCLAISGVYRYGMTVYTGGLNVLHKSCVQ